MSMPKKTIDKIFGVRPVSAIPGGMRILRKVTRRDGTREQLCRDADGRYHMVVEPEKAGDESDLGMGRYTVDRRVIMPISRECVLLWVTYYFGCDKSWAAKEGLREYEYRKMVWEHRKAPSTERPGTDEWLMKSDEGEFVLYSTDESYPFCTGSVSFLRFSDDDGTGGFEGDVCIYYIPEETARRWAEARGMDAGTYAEVFGGAEAWCRQAEGAGMEMVG